jgi:hypothetical protein
MDNTNRLSNNLLQPATTQISSFSETSSNSFLTWLKNIPVIGWIGIILVLAFLGINIFSYLAKGTQDVTNVFQPLINKITSLSGKLTGQLTNATAQGTKEVVNATTGAVNTTAGAINTGLTDVQNVATNNTPTPATSTTANPTVPVQNTTQPQETTQSSALNTALNSYYPEQQVGGTGEDYQADDTTSTIQSGTSKSGWCYIGEDRGFRTCAEIGTNQTCMSGEIFPSQDICINPSLRA